MSKINKVHIFSIGIVMILSIPAVFALFHAGFFSTDDGEWMIIRFSAFYQAVKETQIPVRFLTRLNFSYGYPVATFLYPGFMYFAVPFKVLGFGFVDTIKIILGLSIVGSGIFTYFWLSKRFRMLAGIAGALVYIYVPYHLYDVYTRGSVGEVFALFWVPFIFWMIERKSIFWVSVGISALIISHNTLAVLFMPLIVLYMLIIAYQQKFKKNIVISYILSVVFGIGLSAFFWLPAIVQLRFTRFSHVKVSDPYSYFAQSGVIGYSIFLILIASIFLSVLEFRKVKKIKSEVVLFEAVAVISIFLASAVSTLIWRVIPSSFIQFPFRMLSYLPPAAAFLSAFIISEMTGYRKKVIAVIIFAAVAISAYPFILPKSFFDHGEGYYYTNDATTTVQNEYMPVWVKHVPLKAPEQKIEVIKGNIAVSSILANNKIISFSVNATQSSLLKINTVYWPGWKVTVDGQKADISLDDTGLMTVSVPKGTHSIMLKFGENATDLFSDAVSIVSVLSLLGYIGLRRKATG